MCTGTSFQVGWPISHTFIPASIPRPRVYARWYILHGLNNAVWLVSTYMCVQIAEAHRRELRLLQQEQQVSIARAKEEVREAKSREISEIWAKNNQVGGGEREQEPWAVARGMLILLELH